MLGFPLWRAICCLSLPDFSAYFCMRRVSSIKVDHIVEIGGGGTASGLGVAALVLLVGLGRSQS